MIHVAADSDSIGTRLNEVIQEKEQAAEVEDYEKAANLRHEEIQLRKQLEEAKQNGEAENVEVSVADIELIVEEKTGIPVTKLQAAEQAKMKGIGKILAKKSLVKKKRSIKLQKQSVVAVRDLNPKIVQSDPSYLLVQRVSVKQKLQKSWQKNYLVHATR